MVKRNRAGEFVSDLQDRIDQLRSAGFSLGYAHRSDVNQACSYLASRHLTSEYYLGRRIVVVDDTDHDDYGQPFVDFGGVAADDEGHEQCGTGQRSNFRVLLNNDDSREVNGEPRMFIKVGYGRTDVLGAFVADLDDDTLQTMIGLREQYPVLDESDLSELEHEEIYASWGEYLRDDLYNEMARIHRHNGAMQTIWDRLGEKRVGDLFWDAVREEKFGGCIPDHDGKDVLWGRQEDMVRVFREILIRAYWDARKGCSQCGSDSDECMQGCKYQGGEASGE